MGCSANNPKKCGRPNTIENQKKGQDFLKSKTK
jgi:hypothetical protein